MGTGPPSQRLGQLGLRIVLGLGFAMADFSDGTPESGNPAPIFLAKIVIFQRFKEICELLRPQNLWVQNFCDFGKWLDMRDGKWLRKNLGFLQKPRFFTKT